MFRNRPPDGFTLVELLIAMTFAMILAAIALNAFSAPKQEAFRSSIQSDLRALAVAQEIYHQTHFQYGQLADLIDYETTRSVTVSVNHNTGTGFAATATHAGLPSVTCGIYIGDVPSGTTGPATEPGRPVCD